MLSLNDMKPLGAFIENTVRPILAELKESGLDIKMEDIHKITTKLVVAHTICLIFSTIKDVAIYLAIGYFICKTLLL